MEDKILFNILLLEVEVLKIHARNFVKVKLHKTRNFHRLKTFIFCVHIFNNHNSNQSYKAIAVYPQTCYNFQRTI